jgi:hypothetical protein
MNLLTRQILMPLNRWAEHSQTTARRNAMVASTELGALRRERDEVQEYVESLLAQRGAPASRVEAMEHEVARLG